MSIGLQLFSVDISPVYILHAHCVCVCVRVCVCVCVCNIGGDIMEHGYVLCVWPSSNHQKSTNFSQ